MEGRGWLEWASVIEVHTLLGDRNNLIVGVCLLRHYDVMHYCSAALLHYNTAALLHHGTTALSYYCTTVLLHY